MSSRVDPFTTIAAEAPWGAPRNTQATDPGFIGLSSLGLLRDQLRLAAQFHAEILRVRGSGQPPLFFFHQRGPGTPTRQLADPLIFRTVSARMPVQAAAWTTLPEFLDATFERLKTSAPERRIARSMPDFVELLAKLAPDVPSSQILQRLLTVADDEVILAIYPAARVGVRLAITGVAEIHHLHVLLASALSGDPRDDLLTGHQPDPRVVAAYRGLGTHPEPPIAEAIFQLYRPSALRPDGSLPADFSGSDYWLPGEASPTVLPLERGERVVLLGDPVIPMSWDAVPLYPGMPMTVSRIEVLTRQAVEEWLEKRCPQLPELLPSRAAA